MLNKIPIYEATIDENDDNTGIFCMSLVENPAVMVNWELFSQNPKLLRFNNDEKQLISGVVMLADTPIYRYSENYGEYYIKYSKETIQKMADKFLFGDNHKNVDIEHNGILLDNSKIHLVELMIKDTTKGITTLFSDVPDGSLIATYKVLDKTLWENLKNSKLSGFSLSGFFDLCETNCFLENYSTQIKNNIKIKMSKIKNIIKTLLNFTEKEAKKGDETITLVYDGEFTEGTAVTDADGNSVPDGTYEVDGNSVEIENSVVKKLDKISEENLDENSELDAIKAEVEELKKEIEELKKAIEGSVEVTPVVEEYANIVKNSKLKGASKILSHLVK